MEQIGKHLKLGGRYSKAGGIDTKPGGDVLFNDCFTLLPPSSFGGGRGSKMRNWCLIICFSKNSSLRKAKKIEKLGDGKIVIVSLFNEALIGV